MLVFIDESGDPGLKLTQGSSQFFTVSLVIFEDNSEAEACDKRIERLKNELGWKGQSEFHFSRNSDKIREVFLKLVSTYKFFYYGIVINKDPKKLWGEGFKNKESFYKYACGLVFENAKEKLKRSTVIIDQNGNLEFRNHLAKYLRNKINTQDKIIHKIKMQRSSGNNLLQLADYIAGVINKSVEARKKQSNSFRKIISHREIKVQVWPK